MVVGVNAFTVQEPPPAIPAPDYTSLAERQKARVRAVRARRDGSAWRAALAALTQAAATEGAPLMEPILSAVRARASVGEISDTLRGEWGTFQRQP